MRRLPFVPLILTAVLGLSAGEVAAAASDSASSVAPSRLLSIQEIDAKGKAVSYSCPDGVSSCSVDVASTLVITPHLGSVSQGPNAPSPAPPSLGIVTREQREALKEALDSLKMSSDLSLKLRQEHTKLRLQGFANLSVEDETRIAILSRGFEKERSKAYIALLRYARADPSAFSLTAEDLANENDALRKIGAQVPRGELGIWLAARLQVHENEAVLNASRILSQAPVLTLRLGAFRVRRGKTSAVHLPGYDSFASGVPRTFDRISTSLTEAQRERLSEEIGFTSDVISSAQSVVAGGKEVSKDLAKTRSEIEAGLATALSELKTLLPALKKDVVAALQKLKDDVAANPTFAQQAAAIASAQKNAESIESGLSSLRDAVEKLQRLSSGPGSAVDRPDQFLLQLLAATDQVTKEVVSAFQSAKAIPATVLSLRTSVDTLAAAPQFQQAFAARLAELRQTLTQDLSPSVAKILTSLGPVGALFEKGGQLVGLVKNEAELLANSKALESIDLSSPSILSVPENEAVPTELAILRTDAEDGDILEIVGELRTDKEREPIREERRSVTVRTFGWSSNVSGGLVFAKSIQVDTSNFKPEPAASWRIGYRARPADSSFGATVGRFLAPGFGIHVVSLDFSSDVAVELGAGLNVHLFSDLVQAGYGWNLSVKEKRSYWYLGIGLFELLKVVR
jgi:hypothetical protein